MAVKELKQSAAKLKTVGRMYKDEKLLKEAQEMEVQADMIQDKGMSKKSRKVMRAESYQMKNQQLSEQWKNWYWLQYDKKKINHYILGTIFSAHNDHGSNCPETPGP